MGAPGEAQAPLPRVQGYVEAIGEGGIHGWAWSPEEPAARLSVVLRDGEAVLQTVIADQPRPDLAKHGVGDGAHAFVLELDAGLAARAGELEVVAVASDGSELVLAAPPPPVNGVSELRRALESLAGSQRVLHRNLQALLLASKSREPLDAALDRIAETQKALDARTAELELFVTRLDERLAGMVPAAAAGASRNGRVALAAAGAVAVIGVAGVLARIAG